jgi:hypothetical protein
VARGHSKAIKALHLELRKNPSALKKRMELLQHYFLSHNVGNADYQGYLIFKSLERNSLMTATLKNAFVSYDAFKSRYDRGRMTNSEYQILVFPLADALKISYIHPIDDLSTWALYEKYYDKLQVRDPTDSLKANYQRRVKEFKETIAALPKDENQWIMLNSPAFTKQLLVLEGYTIQSDSLHNDLKIRYRYWVLRNKVMARNIDKVARTHPGKNLVVFFGVSHVGAVREELNKLDRRYDILLLNDIIK